jgi:hypothetical protein
MSAVRRSSVTRAKRRRKEKKLQSEMSGFASVTRQGKDKRDGNLAEFFAKSPLRGSGLKFARRAGKLRDPRL